MKIGFNSGAFGDYPLTEVMPRLAALGYQGVELSAETAPWTRPHVTPRLGAKRRAEVRRLARDHGLEISSISAHTSLVDADRRTRQRHLDFVKGCIDMAPDLGTGVVHAIAGGLPDGVSAERAWGWLVEGLASCIRHAAERGVTFAFEAVVMSIVPSMADLSRLLADLGEDKLFVNFDPGHLVVVGEDPAGWIRTLGPSIVHLHLKDARTIPSDFALPPLEKGAFRFTTEFEFLPPGRGVIRFGEIVSALREIGYRGFLSVEYEGVAFGSREDPWDVAVEAKRFIDDLLAA